MQEVEILAEQAVKNMSDAPQTSAPAGLREVPRIGARGRAEAAALMWKWQNSDAASGEASVDALRKRGMMQGAVGLVIAGFFFAIGWKIMSAVVATIGTLTLILALASPGRAYAAIDRMLQKLSGAVGGAVAWLVLMPVFIGFFVPFGLIFRRGEKDPMKRQFAPGATSYWREREADDDMEGRRKTQF